MGRLPVGEGDFWCTTLCVYSVYSACSLYDKQSPRLAGGWNDEGHVRSVFAGKPDAVAVSDPVHPDHCYSRCCHPDTMSVQLPSLERVAYKFLMLLTSSLQADLCFAVALTMILLLVVLVFIPRAVSVSRLIELQFDVVCKV